MDEITTESNWEITAKRYVAYFDIMGFKDMVLRTSHIEIYEMMKNIDEKIKRTENIEWGNIERGKHIKITTYSDSIMIYSKDDSYSSLVALICTVSALTNELLTDAIPHKGAVAFGTMTLDTANSIFFGQPLIDAYLLQEELYFYGVIAHATIEQEIEIKFQNVTLPFYMNYLCHFKKGNSIHKIILPAFVYPSMPKYQKFTDALFASCNKLRLKTSGHLRIYIDNTEKYLKNIREKLEAAA